jgi:hypothetical protein
VERVLGKLNQVRTAISRIGFFFGQMLKKTGLESFISGHITSSLTASSNSGFGMNKFLLSSGAILT